MNNSSVKSNPAQAASPRDSRRLSSTRSLLFVLVGATIIPIFLFSAWLIVLQANSEMAGIEQRLLNTAQAVAIDVDREVVATINALQTLALGFDLDTAPPSEFQELSSRMLSTQRNWRTVIVRDPSGKPLANILRKADQDTQLPDFVVESGLGGAELEKGKPIESPLASLLGSSVGVHVPIIVEKKTAYVASVLLDPKIFADLLTGHKISSEWLVSILDPKNIVVASTRLAEKLFGKPTQLLVEGSTQTAHGRLFRTEIEDVPSYVILSTAPVSRWSVALAVPATVVEAPFYRTIWLIIIIGVLCLVFGIVIAYLIGRKVARPLERLAESARDRAQGKISENVTNGSLAEVQMIDEALNESSRLLRAREQERDQFHEQLEVRLKELTQLHKLSTGLLAIEDRQALLNEIVAGALILVDTDKSSLALLDQHSQNLTMMAQVGFDDEPPIFLHGRSPGHGPAGSALASRRLVVVEDVENNSTLNDEERAAALQAGIRAVLALPLVGRRGEIVGVLSTYFAQPWKPSPWKEILLDLYAQFCVNVLQQMSAKDHLRVQNNGLAQRVKDHTDKLNEAYQRRIADLSKQSELETQLREAQKMELVGTLAGGVAHDFNNILNIISTYAFLVDAKKENAPIDAEVQTIKDTVQRGAAVVRQLLAVARKTEVKFEATDLNSLVRSVTELLVQTFPKTITFAHEFDESMPPAMLDANQITQAVINLCVNARDAMPEGGRIVIATQYLNISEAKRRFPEAGDVPYAMIAIADTGSGIDEETAKHIFEPFFTTKGPGRGTGLGLSVVYSIAQSHGGFVHFNSEVGQGTIFYLCLPVEELATATSWRVTPLTASPQSEGRGTTILIVEDEEKQLDALRTVFEGKGYRVLMAAERDAALETFTAHKDEIAVVLLDLGLPGGNGWEIFQKMKEINPAVKVVFATGYILPEMDMEAARRESHGIVMKPYSIAEVLETVAQTAGISSAIQ